MRNINIYRHSGDNGHIIVDITDYYISVIIIIKHISSEHAAEIENSSVSLACISGVLKSVCYKITSLNLSAVLSGLKKQHNQNKYSNSRQL